MIFIERYAVRRPGQEAGRFGPSWYICLRCCRFIVFDTLLELLDSLFGTASHSILGPTLLPGPQGRALDASNATLMAGFSFFTFHASECASIAGIGVSEPCCHDESGRGRSESDDVGVKFAPLATGVVICWYGPGRDEKYYLIIIVPVRSASIERVCRW